MRSGVVAQKVGMTRIFTEAGEHIPVTVLKLDNVQVVGHRTNDKNGYTALQLGAGTRKIVFASGGGVYGHVDEDGLPIRESQPQRPVTPSAVAKKAATDYLSAAREVHGIEFTALALATVYGPRDVHGAIASFASSLRAGRPTTIDGDGRQTRDLLYVDDAVDALVRAAERGSGLLVNIGTGRETSVLDAFRTVARQVGMPNEAPVHGPGRPGDLARVALDPGRARIHLGWTPWTDLETGVAETLRALDR